MLFPSSFFIFSLSINMRLYFSKLFLLIIAICNGLGVNATCYRRIKLETPLHKVNFARNPNTYFMEPNLSVSKHQKP